MQGKKETTGPRPQRADTVTMRFDPKLKYLATVVGRYERRSLSSIFELAVERYIKEFAKNTLTGASNDSFDMSGQLWSPNEIMRFALLADELPDMLLPEEEILWRLMMEDGSLWKEPPPLGVRNKLRLDVAEKKWDAFVKKAEQLSEKERSIAADLRPKKGTV